MRSESPIIPRSEVHASSLTPASRHPGFVPGIIERYRDRLDEVIEIASPDAVAEMRRIARVHGMLVGPSSGAHLLAARRIMQADPALQTVVTLFPDEGEKYLGEPEFYG